MPADEIRCITCSVHALAVGKRALTNNYALGNAYVFLIFSMFQKEFHLALSVCLYDHYAARIHDDFSAPC